MTMANLNLPVPPGPATKSYYEVPPVHQTTPELRIPGKFRSELSLAFSKAYHLLPHALILSYLEGKPVGLYFDQEAYTLSGSFYDDNCTPGHDACQTRASINASRKLFHLNQLPKEDDPERENEW
jgi:hypothetical protein